VTPLKRLLEFLSPARGRGHVRGIDVRIPTFPPKERSPIRDVRTQRQNSASRMMMGMGTPSSQSRMERPIVISAGWR
jgi:hypothetical protein